MSTKPFQWLKWVLPASLLLIGWSISQPLVNRSHGNGQRMQCQSNLKQIGLGFMQYLQDYDDRFPPLSAENQGWAESLQPYLKSPQIFQCPQVSNATDKFTSDYFFNARLAGLPRKQIQTGALTILLGEGLDNGATNSHFSEMPLDWASDENSPTHRHLDGSNWAWVDGHVKWLRPQKITIKKPQENYFTFAIR